MTSAATALDALARPTAGRNGGHIELVERTGARAGVMPPLQEHSDDASYFVREGSLTFFVGGDVVVAHAGDVVVAPRDVPHTFRVDVAGTRWLLLTRVASSRRAADLAHALAEPVADWPSIEERATVEAIAAANGIRILGPPGALPAP